MDRTDQSLLVEAPARLHFGVLDLRGLRGRWFGGIGAAAPAPTLLVSVASAETLKILGDDTGRAAEFARRFLRYHGIERGASVRVHRSLPAHAGLGSGTQLALAVACGLAKLHGIATDPPGLARAVGRGQRSAIGTWTFAGGGLVLEGGRRPESEGLAPLLARLPFPPTWRCVVAVPHATSGICGATETAALARLPIPPQHDVERVAHLVLMGLLPSLAEADLRTFGASLTAIEAITGHWFAPVQGGIFAPGPGEELIRRMPGWGAACAGQSSWGPAIYGITDGEDAGQRLAERVRAALGTAGDVYEGPFRTDGARFCGWANAKQAECS